MPELPEVETTCRILDKKIKNLFIEDVWTDYRGKSAKYSLGIKDSEYFYNFKKEIINKKILGVERRAKNVLIKLSEGNTVLIHMKMTGHLLYGEYDFLNKKWSPKEGGALKDPYNRFVHLVFSLSDGKKLVLSDARKFAKILLLEREKCEEEFCETGPEPLNKSFSYKIFTERINKRPKSKIKTVLMDQNVIAGIGNIYSDEILWTSSVHPEKIVKNLSEKQKKEIYKNIRIILEKSIKLGGDSMSDYRNPYGEKGRFQDFHKVYRKTGEKCVKKGCSGIIKRIIVGGRSTHFCPVHQV
ncbi:MAG: DNA-formamidopyrimidine glycosylase [Minisyncoccia bacterium]